MRYLVMILSLCLLVACYSGGRKGGDAALAIYDFGPESLPSSGASLSGAVALEVKAPLWFDGLGIGYRLAYAEPNRLREYARSRWVGPPAQLMQQRLVQRLGANAAGQGRVQCVLRIEIAEFSQLFETPTSSIAVLSGKAILFDRTRRALDERSVVFRRVAASPDARGGVRALAETVDDLAASLADWAVLTTACKRSL